MDVKFGIQIGSVWHQMGQNLDAKFDEPNCTETDLKKSQICPIWGQSDPIRMANLPSLVPTRVVGVVLIDSAVDIANYLNTLHRFD